MKSLAVLLALSAPAIAQQSGGACSVSSKDATSTFTSTEEECFHQGGAFYPNGWHTLNNHTIVMGTGTMSSASPRAICTYKCAKELIDPK